MRLFIALALTEEVKNYLSSMQEKLRACLKDAKWVETRNLHLTLRFLGQVSEDSLDPVRRAMGTVLKGQTSFEMSFSGLGAFPSLEFPRVLWVGVEKGKDQVACLALRLNSELEKIGFFAEEQAFHAHLTLARLRSALRSSQRREFEEYVKEAPLSFSPPSMRVPGCELMVSRLSPQGPIYQTLYHGDFS